MIERPTDFLIMEAIYKFTTAILSKGVEYEGITIIVPPTVFMLLLDEATVFAFNRQTALAEGFKNQEIQVCGVTVKCQTPTL